MKQNKIQTEESVQTNDIAQTEEQTLIAQILDVCVFANPKEDTEIMLSSLHAELRGHPLNINAQAVVKLAAMIGKTEAVTKRKVKALCTNGYMHIDGEQYLYTIPRARIGKTETQCAEALMRYQSYLLAPVTKRRNAKTASQLLGDMCPALKESIDAEVCALHRYPECEGCKWECEEERMKKKRSINAR